MEDDIVDDMVIYIDNPKEYTHTHATRTYTHTHKRNNESSKVA